MPGKPFAIEAQQGEALRIDRGARARLGSRADPRRLRLHDRISRSSGTIATPRSPRSTKAPRRSSSSSSPATWSAASTRNAVGIFRRKSSRAGKGVRGTVPGHEIDRISGQGPLPARRHSDPERRLCHLRRRRENVHREEPRLVGSQEPSDDGRPRQSGRHQVRRRRRARRNARERTDRQASRLDSEPRRRDGEVAAGRRKNEHRERGLHLDHGRSRCAHAGVHLQRQGRHGRRRSRRARSRRDREVLGRSGDRLLAVHRALAVLRGEAARRLRQNVPEDLRRALRPVHGLRRELARDQPARAHQRGHGDRGRREGRPRRQRPLETSRRAGLEQSGAVG